MELNSGDIQNLIAIIDLATQKGFFKASDLITIGQLYEKLNAMHIALCKKDKTN